MFTKAEFESNPLIIGVIYVSQNAYQNEQKRNPTARPRQNGSHFADDICILIFCENADCCSLIQISSKFAFKGRIENKPALVQRLACTAQETNHDMT